MAARYWRIAGIETAGFDDLEISELQFIYNNVQVTGATVTCSVAPDSGSLANLFDGNLSTAARWSADKIHAGGFSITADFGSDVTVDSLRIGAGTAASRFPYALFLLYSSDALNWTAYRDTMNIVYPGDATLSALAPANAATSDDVLFMRFEGSNGSTTVVDDVGHVFTAYGTTALTTSSPLAGGSSLALGGATGDYVSTPADSSLNLGTGAMTLELRCTLGVLSQDQYLVGRMLNAGGISAEWLLFWRASTQTFSFYTGLRGSNSVVRNFASPVTIVAGGSYHVECNRNASGQWLLFVNGVVSATISNVDRTDLSNASNQIPLFVGGCGFEYNTAVKIDDVRLTKGLARHTVSFVPPPNIASPASLLPLAGVQTARHGVRQVRSKRLLGLQTDFSVLHTDRVSSGRKVRDTAFGGSGVISGTIKKKADPTNIPERRKVRLYNDFDGVFVAETWSDSVTGNYTFANLDPAKAYTVIAYDYLHDDRAVVADNITPTV